MEYDFVVGIEESSQYIDAFLNDRTGIVVQDQTYSSTVGLEAPFVNSGKTVTRGLELNLGYGQTIGDVGLYLGVMGTWITDRVDFNGEIPSASPSADPIGRKIWTYFGYEADGFYTEDDLVDIVKRAGHILNISLSDDGAKEIAKRSRGTPRVANRLLKRVRDFAVVDNKNTIDSSEAKISLQKLSVDEFGLDNLDRKYLKLIIENYMGGPVGIETLSALLSEEIDTIEDVIEPYLLQIGFLQRTPRGRVITEKAYKHLGLSDLFVKKEN